MIEVETRLQWIEVRAEKEKLERMSEVLLSSKGGKRVVVEIRERNRELEREKQSSVLQIEMGVNQGRVWATSEADDMLWL